MTERDVVEELDKEIDALLTKRMSRCPQTDSTAMELLDVAAELRDLPGEGFKANLKAELMEAAAVRAAGRKPRLTVISRKEEQNKPMEPTYNLTFLGPGFGSRSRGSTFAASMTLHAAAMALVLYSGFLFVGKHLDLPQHVVSILADPNLAILAPAPERSGGGGGGGDRSKMDASQGALPKTSREQITPPMVVVRSENPKLTAESTVVAPPDLKLAQLGQLGNPFANTLGNLSNGSGSGGGIGNGNGTGVGSGYGPGVGPGSGGGYGGGVYRVGAGVSAPRALYDPDAEYSEEARRVKYQGTVLLAMIVTPEGTTRDIHVLRSLGMGLDEKAMDAVQRWRFKPAEKDGRPVAVMIQVEVSFHLY